MAIRLMLALIVAGTVLPAQQSMFGPTAGAVVSGRVLDADTGTPLRGVSVGSRESGWIDTDAEGRYALRNLRPGRSEIWIKGEYIAVSFAEPKAVTVTDGRDISNLDFHVRLFGTISGRVTDEHGAPVSGAAVVAVANEYGRTDLSNDLMPFAIGELTRIAKYRATTTDRGEYRFDRVLAGRPYRILAYKPLWALRSVGQSVPSPAARPHVIAATYFPHVATFDAATPVTIQSHERRERVDITMVEGPSSCVLINTRSGGAPASLFVSLEAAEVSALGDGGSETGRSAADGAVRVCDLAPGTYRLSAASSASDWYSGTVSVTIQDRDLSDLVVTPEPVVRVSGEISWAGTGPAGGPGPIVTLRTLPNRLGLRRQDLGGAFWAMFPPGQSYSLHIGVDAPSYVRDITYDGSSIVHRTLTPLTSAAEPLRITVGRDGAYLRARVRLADGQPAANRWVMVLASDAATEAELAGGILAGISDADGVCQMAGLRPGSYRVLATDIGPPAQFPLPSQQPWIDRTPETMTMLFRARDRGASVVLAPGARVEIAVSPTALK